MLSDYNQTGCDHNDMEIKKEIGKRLKAAREALDYKLKDVVLGIDELSISRLSNYEQGERMLPVDIAIKLEKKLEVQPAYLLTLTNSKTKGVEVENEIERQLLFFFRNATEDHQNDIIRLANQLYSIDKPDDKTANPLNGNIKEKSKGNQ